MVRWDSHLTTGRTSAVSAAARNATGSKVASAINASPLKPNNRVKRIVISPFVLSAGVLRHRRCFYQVMRNAERKRIIKINQKLGCHLAGGGSGSFFGLRDRFAGGCASPGGTCVAQVLPDS